MYAVDAADAQASGDSQPGSGSQTAGGAEQRTQNERQPLRREELENGRQRPPLDKDTVAGGKQQTPWYRCRQVQLTVLGYGLIALYNTFVNELIVRPYLFPSPLSCLP